MLIQPITKGQSFSGKLVLEKDIIKDNPQLSKKLLDMKFKTISGLVQDKPYDLFIFKDEQFDKFYDVAANKSLEKAKKVKEYTVKIQPEIMLASLIDAAKDAIEMYEKYISKSAKG